MFSTIVASIIVCAVKLRIKKFSDAICEETKHNCSFYWMAICSMQTTVLGFMVWNNTASCQLMYTGYWKSFLLGHSARKSTIKVFSEDNDHVWDRTACWDLEFATPLSSLSIFIQFKATSYEAYIHVVSNVTQLTRLAFLSVWKCTIRCHFCHKARTRKNKLMKSLFIVCLTACSYFSPLLSPFSSSKTSVRNMLQLYKCCLSHAVPVGSSLSHFYTWKVAPSLGILFFPCGEVGHEECQLVILCWNSATISYIKNRNKYSASSGL